jgi:hypothetical protein
MAALKVATAAMTPTRTVSSPTADEPAAELAEATPSAIRTGRDGGAGGSGVVTSGGAGNGACDVGCSEGGEGEGEGEGEAEGEGEGGVIGACGGGDGVGCGAAGTKRPFPLPTYHGGGEGRAGGDVGEEGTDGEHRGPQSAQSVPSAQLAPSALGPPSSHRWLKPLTAWRKESIRAERVRALHSRSHVQGS